MERPDPAVSESDGLGRIRNARRNVGIIEWIEERIAKEHERAAAMMMMMAAHKTDAGKSETVTITVTIRAVWISVTVRSRRVIYINPSLSWTAAHIAHNFPIGRAPGQPDCILRHTRANLSLADKRLVPRRKSLVNFGVPGDSRLGRGTTRKN